RLQEREESDSVVAIASALVAHSQSQRMFRGVLQSVCASHKDLERLEDAAGLSSLLAGVPDEGLGALADEPETLQEGGMQREGDQALGGFKSAEGAKATIVHPTPGALELLPGRLPFVKLSLPYLAPTL